MNWIEMGMRQNTDLLACLHSAMVYEGGLLSGSTQAMR